MARPSSFRPFCPDQVFPGNDVHGGFGTHLRVPSRGLCEVPDLSDPKHNPHGLELSTLSVIADAVTTPYQAVQRSHLGDGDLAIFVGVGGVDGFGVQIAAALGATVAAIDVDSSRLERVAKHGAALVMSPTEVDFRTMKKHLAKFARCF